MNELQMREALRRRPALRKALSYRAEAETGAIGTKLRGYLFPVQQAFVGSTAKRKAALCSRRAGKTFGIAAWLYDGALKRPRSMSVYITEALPQARRNVMPALERMNIDLGLGMRQRTIDGQLICELPNGHRIWVAGCDDRSECDKFRGVGAGYTRVVIDEAGSGALPKYLDYLHDDVLTPALLDQNGELALTGTPGLVCAGLFYRATTGDGGPQWETHHWTLLENPHLPDASEFLERTKANNGWDDQSPQYRREYLGEWVHDRTVLALPFDWQKNAIGELPSEDGVKSRWDYSLGVDVGTVAPSAFVVIASRRGLPDMFVVKSFQREGLTPSGMAGLVQQLDAEYRFRDIWVDTGGLGAGYAAEMVERYGVRLQAAKKTDKRLGIEIVRGELHSGNLKVLPRDNRELLDEMAQLPMNEDGTNFDASHFACHLSDALVYAVRGCKPYYTALEERRAPTPEEVQAEFLKQHKAKAASAIENAKRNRDRSWLKK